MRFNLGDQRELKRAIDRIRIVIRIQTHAAHAFIYKQKTNI